MYFLPQCQQPPVKIQHTSWIIHSWQVLLSTLPRIVMKPIVLTVKPRRRPGEEADWCLGGFPKVLFDRTNFHTLSHSYWLSSRVLRLWSVVWTPLSAFHLFIYTEMYVGHLALYYSLIFVLVVMCRRVPCVSSNGRTLQGRHRLWG